MAGIGHKDYGGDRWFAYAIMACIVVSLFGGCVSAVYTYFAPDPGMHPADVEYWQPDPGPTPDRF